MICFVVIYICLPILCTKKVIADETLNWLMNILVFICVRLLSYKAEDNLKFILTEYGCVFG